MRSSGQATLSSSTATSELNKPFSNSIHFVILGAFFVVRIKYISQLKLWMWRATICLAIFCWLQFSRLFCFVLFLFCGLCVMWIKRLVRINFCPHFPWHFQQGITTSMQSFDRKQVSWLVSQAIHSFFSRKKVNESFYYFFIGVTLIFALCFHTYSNSKSLTNFKF